MSYNTVYKPQPEDRSKHVKGNGSETGCEAGHKQKPLTNSGSFVYGKGCLQWGIDNCELCTRPECDWNYTTEYNLRKKLNEKNRVKHL